MLLRHILTSVLLNRCGDLLSRFSAARRFIYKRKQILSVISRRIRVYIYHGQAMKQTEQKVQVRSETELAREVVWQQQRWH
jgi:hypothetical protein